MKKLSILLNDNKQMLTEFSFYLID